MNEAVAISLTPCEAEALVFFLAERKALWATTAVSFGVDAVMRVPRELVTAHGGAVKRFHGKGKR